MNVRRKLSKDCCLLVLHLPHLHLFLILPFIKKQEISLPPGVSWSVCGFEVEMLPICFASQGAVGRAYWGTLSLSLVLHTHTLAKHNIILFCIATKTCFLKGLWPVPLVFRNNFTLAASCASIFTIPQRDFSTWFVGVRGLHWEMTSVVWLGGVAVSEIKSLNGRIGTNKTEARAETLLCINYIHKSRCKPLFWQLLCFVNQWTMYIFLVWTFWDYEKCTLVIRLVSDPSVVSPLARNWKSFLLLPSWSWEGSLSHLVMSQPWNGPFCWKFLCHVFLSWSCWCSRASPHRQIILMYFLLKDLFFFFSFSPSTFV